MRAHEGQQQAEIRALLPVVAGILESSERLPWTTSSCEIGRMKFSGPCVYEGERDEMMIVGR